MNYNNSKGNAGIYKKTQSGDTDVGKDFTQL